jgi:hypothetical protein
MAFRLSGNYSHFVSIRKSSLFNSTLPLDTFVGKTLLAGELVNWVFHQL